MVGKNCSSTGHHDGKFSTYLSKSINLIVACPCTLIDVDGARTIAKGTGQGQVFCLAVLIGQSAFLPMPTRVLPQFLWGWEI